MQNTTKILIKGAIVNCGITTALINGIINYFTLTKASVLVSNDLAFNFFIIALGCGVICPFFGGLILKGVAAKNKLDFGVKNEQMITKFIPNNLFLGTLAISILTVAAVWLLPYLVAAIIDIQISLSRIIWILTVGLYSGVAASFAAYFGMKRAHYTQN